MPIWLEILKAQEQGKAQAREAHRLNKNTREISKSKSEQSTKQKQTYIFEKSNYYVPLALTLIDIKNKSGVIEELLIKSPSSNFSIVMGVDDREYQRTWTEYNELSQDIDSIVAVKRSDKYILHLSNIYFKDKVNILLSGQGTTFDKIYLRVTYEY